MPSMADKSQCLAFVGASESVRDKYGVDEATESDQFGVVVPMPTFLFELTIRPFPATVRSEEKRLVELAVVAKLVVEVALVVVLLSPVKLESVDEADERNPFARVTSPLFPIVKYVLVEVKLSDEVPILKIPSTADKSQCLAFVGASESVRDKYGVDEATESVQFGVVVPMPMLPPLTIVIASVKLTPSFNGCATSL